MKKITYDTLGCCKGCPWIAVVTPSVRKKGLEIVRQSLKGQTFNHSIKWFIGSPFNPEIPEATWVEDDFTGGCWSLNRIYNKIFKEIKKDPCLIVVVTLQDWIYVPPDGLEKFIEAFKSVGEKSIISGVGDQYESLNEYGKPQVKIWNDPRKRFDQGSFYECYSNDVEWNYAAFPRNAIFEVGGMDEGLDKLGVGGDQLQVGERWDALGYKFYLDQANESFTIRHDRSDFGGQEEWDKKHVLFAQIDGVSLYDRRKAELVALGQWPILPYLK